MQRIKSQSTCQVQGHLVPSQARGRSKRGTKAQISQVNQQTIEKLKNNNTPFTQNSLVSIKSNPKTLACSMKNLKVIQHNNSLAKNSVQNTSRVLNQNNSGISARILKQIIGYSHKGPNKIKSSSRDGYDNDHKEQVTLQIDLTYEALNKSHKKQQKEEQQPRTTLSQNRKKSTDKKDKQGKNNSNGKNNNKIYKNNDKGQHRIVQQFSPLNLSPRQQNKTKQQNNQIPVLKCEISDKFCKINPFLPINDKNDESSQPVMNEHQNQKQNNLSDDKDRSLINMLYKQYTQNKRFNESSLRPTSPNISNLSNIFEKSLASRRSPTNFMSNLNKQNIQKFSNNFMHKKQKVFDVIQIQKPQESEALEKLMLQKQKLIINLQQSTTILDEHFEVNFKQLIPIWKQIMQLEAKKDLWQKQIDQLQKELKTEQMKQHKKKTELFQLNRDQISRKRQKQYMTKRGKNKYLQDAVSCQEALKLKLSSKADYQHVILFNQKVVLTGQKPIQDLENLFVQLFENKLSKKFALIAKKQLANLSVYDARLVQDFLKRIQQLQSCYTKMQSQNNQPNQYNQHYSSVTQQQRLEQLVEQIQQIILSVELLASNLNKIKSQHSQCINKIQELQVEIQEQILRINKKISGEYKMIQGYSFDFQLLLEDKYNKQFQAFRKEMKERDQIIKKLNLIQLQIVKLKQLKQMSKMQVQISNYSTLGQNIKIPKQKSSKKSSLQSTPNKDILKIDHYEQKHINFVGNTMQIQTKSHLDKIFKKSPTFQ